MGGVPDCGKKTGGTDDRSGSIAGVQVVVRSIPATTVLQDQVVLAGVGPNAPYVPCACTCTCGTPYTVPFYPVSASICGEKPRIAGIPADCISLNSVPGALALVARKEDSIISISADVAIGEDVFAALAQKATKVDAIPFVPVDRAGRKNISIALPEGAGRSDPVAPVSGDDAVGYRVLIALAGIAVNVYAVGFIVADDEAG